MRLPQALCEIMELAAAMDVSGINKLPGCWEVKLDDRWWFAINGHKEPTKCSEGTDVPPYSCYVTFNGWPAGIFDPGGGMLCAGAVGNEDNFIAAIKAFREKQKQPA